jgi:hypothetical protein
MTQLKQGIKVESEHKDVYAWLKKACNCQSLPPAKEMYKKIAQTHLREDKSYYSKLKKAKL